MSTLGAVALAGALSVSGQEQKPAEPQQEPGQQERPPGVTLTGCVQEAKTTSGGTAHILNNAQGGSASMYVLLADAKTDFASHVNHKVQVTGQIQPSASGDSSSGDGNSKEKPLRPPLVQVETLKMVAANCK
jgi:hypothetical protein